MLEAEQLRHEYQRPSGPLLVLRGASLAVAAGELVAIRGPSGSGKSTLLLALAGLLQPTGGVVRYRGEDIYTAPVRVRRRLSQGPLRLAFQQGSLAPYLDALQNARLGGRHLDNGDNEADALLDRLGLAERKSHKPAKLSAGEQQRVALARTLAGKPAVLLADEPTSCLDAETTRLVGELLRQRCEQGAAVVVAAHDESILAFADRVLQLHEGELTDA